MTHNRLDPSDIAPEALEALSDMLARPGHVALIDDAGRRAELPAALFHHLVRIVRLMAERRTVALIPEDETFTTQAAADYLGVSRQHLVSLLEGGDIPFHKVGTHRRVTFRDLVQFEKRRDEARKAALDDLASAVDKAGLYDASYTGDEG
jgi:excisionase family DNA binding protein